MTRHQPPHGICLPLETAKVTKNRSAVFVYLMTNVGQSWDSSFHKVFWMIHSSVLFTPSADLHFRSMYQENWSKLLHNTLFKVFDNTF